MSNIQLADNLYYLRKTNNLTQDELSKMLSISRQAYSNYETGKRMPDVDILLHLAQFYCVNLDSIVLHSLRSLDHPSSPPSTQIAEKGIPYTLSKDKNTGNIIYLTEEELDMLTKFRSVSPESKQIITGFLNNYSKR